MKHYRAPRWLAGSGPVGAHLQTIWPALFSRVHAPGAGEVQGSTGLNYVRERWTTPDADFVDVDTLTPSGWESSGKPMLVLFHGLEGSSQSHYARAFGHWAQQQGWAYVVPHFRGCSGELNWAPRFYHSGDHAEIDWILRRVRAQWRGPVLAVGISLGGNVLLRWAQEAAPKPVQWCLPWLRCAHPWIWLRQGMPSVGASIAGPTTACSSTPSSPKPWPSWRNIRACSVEKPCWLRVICTPMTMW